MPFLELQPFGVTDAGKVRRNNEDAFLLGDGKDETLFVVADGIGGFEAGEVASSIAVEVLKDLEPGSPFEGSVREANRRILAVGRGDERLSGMGTTLVAVRFSGSRQEPTVEVAHVGDSRAYLLRGGTLSPITEDHSLVAELVRSGDLTRDQAAEHPQKNLITRALGADEEVDVDTSVLPVEAGDRFLLCSDGLSDMVPEDMISETLTGSLEDPEKAAKDLLSAALDAGGNDNVTVLVVDVKEREPDPAPPPRETSAAADDSEGGASGTREMPAVPSEATGEAPAEAPDPTRGRPPQASRASRAPRASRGRSPRSRGGAGGSSRAGRSAAVRRSRLASKSSRRSRLLARIVRGIAVIVLVALVLAPIYLWGSSRYYFGFDDAEVVGYRGLPYEPFGVRLNEEWRSTGVGESDVNDPYREPIETHKLYTKDEAERVLQDLGS